MTDPEVNSYRLDPEGVERREAREREQSRLTAEQRAANIRRLRRERRAEAIRRLWLRP